MQYFFEINMSTNTGYEWKLHHKWHKKGHFQDTFIYLYFFFFSFDLKSMHCLEAVGFRICLAPKKHGYSVSAQSYDFVLARERWMTLISYCLVCASTFYNKSVCCRSHIIGKGAMMSLQEPRFYNMIFGFYIK